MSADLPRVISIEDDEDVYQIIRLTLLPLAGKIDLWLMADLDGPRGASAAALAAVVEAAALGGRVECLPSAAQAFARSVKLAGENDRIAVFGSFYTVAAVMRSMQSGR